MASAVEILTNLMSIGNWIEGMGLVNTLMEINVPYTMNDHCCVELTRVMKFFLVNNIL